MKIIFNFSLILLILPLFFNQINSEEISISLDIIETDISNDNYEIASKVLTLKTGNDYIISGSCTECQLNVAQKIEMKIILNSISMDNSNTGPFIIGKSAKVELVLEGESSIIDNEDIKNENETSFEGAGIKFKSSSSLTISGEGTLRVSGNPKNGIKGAKKSTLTMNSGTLTISAAKNALACDNLITINGGTINIDSESDGIKSEPDEDDNDSLGTIIINGGNINIYSQSDAIQAAYKLEINGGKFYINTYEGADSSTFNKDTMSAKGLKCSTNEHTNVTNELIINGGEFHLNTSDDAVHSDYNITITKGTFEIITKDDGVHADQYLVLGEKEQEDNSLLNISIGKSYEGLEGSQVYIYSGTYHIIASDDGINAAGDTDENCQNGGGMGPGGNNGGGFGPGGNNGGGFGPGGNNEGGMGPGGNNEGGMGPGGNMGLRNLQMNSQCFIFHIYIYGGDIYVNSGSDGLDANGNVYIQGGNLEVWGMSSGDGSPIDMDGTLYIISGIVLAGGTSGMEPMHQSAKTISQNFIYSTSSHTANKEISIKSGDEVIRTITTPKQISYLFYTSNTTISDYKFSEGTTTYKEGSTNVNPNQGTQGNQGNMPNPPNSAQNQNDERNSFSSSMPNPQNNGQTEGIETNPSSSLDSEENRGHFLINHLIIYVLTFIMF